MALTAYTLCTVYARQVTTLALSTPVEVINTGGKQNYTSGASAYQVSQIYYYSGSLAPSSTVTFNLGNSTLTDNFGQSINMTELRFILFNSLSTLSTMAARIATLSPVTKSLLGYVISTTISIRPMTQFLWSSPQGTSCGSILSIKNSAGGTLSYNFVVVGV